MNKPYFKKAKSLLIFFMKIKIFTKEWQKRVLDLMARLKKIKQFALFKQNVTYSAYQLKLEDNESSIVFRFCLSLLQFAICFWHNYQHCFVLNRGEFSILSYTIQKCTKSKKSCKRGDRCLILKGSDYYVCASFVTIYRGDILKKGEKGNTPKS